MVLSEPDGDNDVPIVDDRPALYDDAHVAGVWWDICAANVHDAREARELVGELLSRQTLPGDTEPVSGALSTWWGPPLREARFAPGAMRVDFHVPNGRARVTWLATGELGSEPGVAAPGEPLRVMESSSRPPITINGNQAMVSIPGAVHAVTEYVSSRNRPMSLTWLATSTE